MNREPLLRKSTWTALAGAVFVLAVLIGKPVSAEWQAAIIGLIGACLPIAAALWARGDVTPLSDPRDNAGQPLTPDSEDNYS